MERGREKIKERRREEKSWHILCDVLYVENEARGSQRGFSERNNNKP